MLITLKGQPKSTQHIYKTMCRGKYPCLYMSKEGKDLKEGYQWQANAQWKQSPLVGPLRLQVDLFFNDVRKHDIDNFHKLSLDALSGIVYIDDSQIQELSTRKLFDKKNPRIEITIYQIPEEDKIY